MNNDNDNDNDTLKVFQQRAEARPRGHERRGSPPVCTPCSTGKLETLGALSETVHRVTREKKTAQRENARSRLQFAVGDFQGLWEGDFQRLWQSPPPSTSRSHPSAPVVELVVSLILSDGFQNHANMQIKFNTMFFWLFSMAGYISQHQETPGTVLPPESEHK